MTRQQEIGRLLMQNLIILVISILIATNAYSNETSASNLGRIECESSQTLHDNMTALTVAAWINVDRTDFWSIQKRTSAGSGWVIQRDTTASPESIQFLAEFSGTDLFRRAGNGTLPDQTDTHLAVTWDGSTTATNAHIYVNGSEVSYLLSTNATGSYNDDSGQELRIGNSFLGSFSEVYIWEDTLTATEISNLYKSRKAGYGKNIHPTNLLSYFPVIEAADGVDMNTLTAEDYSSNENDCVYLNGTITSNASNILTW